MSIVICFAEIASKFINKYEICVFVYWKSNILDNPKFEKIRDPESPRFCGLKTRGLRTLAFELYIPSTVSLSYLNLMEQSFFLWKDKKFSLTDKVN